MEIVKIHAYLVHPKKVGDDKTQTVGTEVTLSGGIFSLIRDIFDRSDSECDIDITFKPNKNGAQQNDCLDLLVAYTEDPSVESGQLIAERLGALTDQRSGLGLLIVVLGSYGQKTKLMISRFPTNSAIYVDDKSKGLTLAFLDRVFVKSRHLYKAVVYAGTSPKNEFWLGKAVDRQIDAQGSTSNYWISEFLLSDFAVTPARGTKRLAQALRAAVQADIPIEVKQEITAVGTLCSTLPKGPTSIDDILSSYSISPAAREEITRYFKNKAVVKEKFVFDNEVFKSIISFKSIELDNGAILTAEAESFDSVFVQSQDKDETRYTTKGRLVDERLASRSGLRARRL